MDVIRKPSAMFKIGTSVKLLEELAINCHTMDFIKKYGSDEFYRLIGQPAVEPTYNNMYELNLEDCLKFEG